MLRTLEELRQEEIAKMKLKLNSMYGKNAVTVMQQLDGGVEKVEIHSPFEANQEIEKMYVVKWKLRDPKDGKEWIEQHEQMTLHDFEVLYGDNIYDIIWCQLRKHGVAMI